MSAQSLTTPDAARSSRTMLSIAIGITLTVCFYFIIPALPDSQGFLQRYFCSHPLEYVTAGLFFIALTILGQKCFGIISENDALRKELVQPAPVPVPDAIEAQLVRLPATIARTQFARRWIDALNYVKGHRSPQGLDSHLRYLAELSGERLHESYSLIRTITWAIPILGFLGTVIGITIAIANVTPEQLDTSLNDVTGGLAVAFDTTALALALSIVLVFAAFIVERAEQQILMRVERIGIERIAHAFGQTQTATGSPLIDAQTSAGQQLVQQMESLVQEQSAVWSEQMQSMRERWSGTLDAQSAELATALSQSTESTLTAHLQQLHSTRDDIVLGFQQSTEQFAGHMYALSEQFAQKIGHWQAALQESSTTAAAQMEAIHEQGQRLLQILEQGDELNRLQETLSRNLDTINAAEKFDEAVHNLSAAVHLLTARSKAA